MHAFLRFLSDHTLGSTSRYGLPVLAVVLATLLRLVAPLDTAPFLLYLPIVVLVGLAFGRGPALVAVITSTLAAAYFFATDDDVPGLATGQVVALVQYLIVGAAMAFVCDALRRAIVQNERTLGELGEVNDALMEGRAELERARQDAIAARDGAEEANRAKSEFLANMSHELRTPLSAVIGYTEMMEEEAEEIGEAGFVKDLGKIKANAKHLLGLINDVLDLSKVEAQKMDVYAEDIDVAAFVRDAASTVEALVAKKDNRLVLDVAADVGAMVSDVTKLRQCLFNLLSNAAKFTQHGTITLRVRRKAAPEDTQGDALVFAVADTGIGMSPDQLARLFQRFTQADETTTRKFGGTGLGLALSRALAQLMGGDITVESEEGRGTTFTLRVPTRLPEPPADDAAAHPLTQDAVAGRDLVLVIDDEASQRELMTRFLERQGFAVRTAPDGPSGLDLARRLAPRVILLDVMMPEMDGWSVLRALKEDPALSGTPVVMVSFVADATLSASLGAVEAVPKPVDFGRLKGILEQFRAHGGDVLVVDDDADMRERLRSVLQKSGWEVREAGNGLEALDAVQAMVPRLILLDLTMPVMDGFAFLHQLRAMAGGADVPVIVLSARDVSASERQALEEATCVLRKDETSLKAVADSVRALATPEAG